MRHTTTTLSFAVVGAFIALMAIKHADLPTTSNPEMNAKGLVVTDNATIGLQSGNATRYS
jgi:hypothetical protein